MRPRAPEAYLGSGLQIVRHDALDGPPPPCNMRDDSDYIIRNTLFRHQRRQRVGTSPVI